METTERADTTIVTDQPTPSLTEDEDGIRTPPVTPTSSQLNKQITIKEDSFSPIVHNAAQVSSLTEQLSTEILKLVVSLYALKLPALTAPGPQIQSSHGSTIHPTSPPKQLHSSPTSTTASSPESSVPPTGSHGPFIRLVTQGQGTLIHLGQLVGILDDHSAFLLQRVVSFDPRRVHLHVIASLRPTDILALTEPRRSRRANEADGTGSFVDDSNLLSQLIATARSMESGKRPGQSESNSPITSLTTRHGPVLTTPGLVLIRADQVRELGIIPENGSADCIISPWVFPEQVETGANSEVSQVSGQQPNNTTVTQQRNTGPADSHRQAEVHCFNKQETQNNSTIQPSITGDSVLNVREDLEKMTVQATSTTIKKLSHSASHGLGFCETNESPSSTDNIETELPGSAHQKSGKNDETVDNSCQPPATRQNSINNPQKRETGRKRVTCNTSKQAGRRMVAQHARTPVVSAGYDTGIAMMNIPKPAANPWQVCGCGRINWGYPVIWRAQGGRCPREFIRSRRRPHAWSGRRSVMS
ncbi:hypothetical protein EG68_04392 [Paragonimus skrjabini miyazakii]|uniref:Uncharacterized protein n=1 Tax=Paragonimus skrjabini miyazakii TaxID=59628 RepID=A0A8S9YZA7_9TREM|nr:hypothetical protein EG68_04392 [Paragonimus skrjabini miyazakii]